MGEALSLVREALALVVNGERGMGGLNPGVHLQEVAGHCRETLGSLRMEGLRVGCLRVDGLGVLVKRMGCLGCWWSLGWERGRESGQVVEGWPRESGEGAGGRLPGIFFKLKGWR